MRASLGHLVLVAVQHCGGPEVATAAAAAGGVVVIGKADRISRQLAQ